MKTFVFFLAAIALLQANAAHAADKPNILIIWGDDVCWNNPSCYNSGMMGYETPNIDRIAKEGARFTDWYGQQSCTAGRAASALISDSGRRFTALTLFFATFWRD